MIVAALLVLFATRFEHMLGRDVAHPLGAGLLVAYFLVSWTLLRESKDRADSSIENDV